MKVAIRNNFLKKFANPKWGTNANTIRTMALALCYSITEYFVPVWASSTYVGILYPELNKAWRAIICRILVSVSGNRASRHKDICMC